MFDALAYGFDLFKTPFLLRFNNKKKSSTYFGALLSLGVFVAICVSFFQSNMIQKQSPNVIEKVVSTYSIQNPESPSITIDDKFPMIPFAFGLTDYQRNIYNDPTIFSIGAYHTFQYGNNTIMKADPLPTKPCEVQDTPLNFDISQLSQVHCAQKGSYKIQGGSQDDIFISIGISLRVCNPSTDNVTCQSPEAIAAYFMDKFFFIYYPDFTYDVDNYEHPIKPEYIFKVTRVSLTSSSMMLHYFQTSKTFGFIQVLKKRCYLKQITMRPIRCNCRQVSSCT